MYGRERSGKEKIQTIRNTQRKTTENMVRKKVKKGEIFLKSKYMERYRNGFVGKGKYGKEAMKMQHV